MLQLVLLLLHLKVKSQEILREKNEENEGEEGGISSSMKDLDKMTRNIPELVEHAWVLEFSLLR
jgi:hypothetical protein